MVSLAVRLLDLGEVSYLHSQTIYHAVAKAMDAQSADTIVLMSPHEPYACIGFHQDLSQEIDLEFCRSQGVPVLRREIGGGTVFLDRKQLFYHCIFHRDRVPRRVEEIYRAFLRAPIETYRRLGIDAALHSLNDIVVGDRKIGGTGAGTIGEAAVVCGSIIFDFDHATMARLLRIPSEAFRRQVERKLRRHVTSLKAELGRDVPEDRVRDLLASQFAEALGRELYPGTLNSREGAIVDELDSIFLADEWRHQISRPSPEVRQVKIKAGALVCEATCDYNGLSARVTLSLADGRIDDLAIAADLGQAERRRVEAGLIGQAPGSPEARSMVQSAVGTERGSIAAAIQSCLSAIGRAVR